MNTKESYGKIASMDVDQEFEDLKVYMDYYITMISQNVQIDVINAKNNSMAKLTKHHIADLEQFRTELVDGSEGLRTRMQRWKKR